MNMKRMMAMAVVTVAIAMVAVSAMAEIVRPVPPSVFVESVKFRQRYPWNGLVDIDCNVTCSDPATNIALYVAAWDNVKDRALTVKTVWIDGDETKNPDLTVKSGAVRIIWDARADNPNEISSDVSVSVQAYVRDMRYLVIDLSGGSNATEYAYSYRAEPPAGGWRIVDKTTNLVLRLVPAGAFTMGSPKNEIGRWETITINGAVYVARETLHKVTLTEPFYVGVFEVTQKQWELVCGTEPSTHKATASTEYIYQCPVETVSYENIRGSSSGRGWPSHNVADANSFIGRIRRRTSLLIDLPTEAQWEYACRAGTTTSLNSGKNLTFGEACENVAIVGRYRHNHNDGKRGWYDYTAMVGQYLPNAWGLYDMHGNVAEWCLDWFSEDLGSEAIVDPVGSSYGSYRVVRGGSFSTTTMAGSAAACRSAYRNYTGSGSYYYTRATPSSPVDNIGFRVVALPDSEKE